MGSSSSKAARTAAGVATRKYPSRTPTATQTQTQTQSQAAAQTSDQAPGVAKQTTSSTSRDSEVRMRPQVGGTRDQAIEYDGRDPQLASHLQRLGPVRPAPTFSPSASTSTSDTASSANATMNPAVATLEARRNIQEAVEREQSEVGRSGFQGRTFLDVTTIRKVLVLRDEQGMPAEDIERALRLRKGVVAMLGRVGVLEAA